eukprot:Nk52_evm1s2148 gene=Nk52_evmTU1s2148
MRNCDWSFGLRRVGWKDKVDCLMSARGFGSVCRTNDIGERDSNADDRRPLKANARETFRALEGVRILDFTRLLPGPLATMFLGEMGAEIIKIDSPMRPDPMRMYSPYLEGGVSTYDAAVNRDKKSVYLDYESTFGRKAFFDLVKTADIVVDQFRPGFLEKIGLGHSEALKHNRSISYIALSGFSETDPVSDKAGHDINFMAESGLLSLNKDKQGFPVIPGFQIGDVAGGTYTLLSACMSCMVASAKGRPGRSLSVSMTDGLVPLSILTLCSYFGTGKIEGNNDIVLGGLNANYQVYECKDGQFMALGALEPKFWVKFCEFANRREEWARIPFDEKASRAENEDLKKQVAAFFSEKTRDEWVELSKDTDFCLSPVREVDEVVGRFETNGALIGNVTNSKSTFLTKGLSFPVKTTSGCQSEGSTETCMEKQSNESGINLVPEMGEHTNEILSRVLKYSAEEIDNVVSESNMTKAERRQRQK